MSFSAVKMSIGLQFVSISASASHKIEKKIHYGSIQLIRKQSYVI